MSLDKHFPIQWSGMTLSQLQLVPRLIQQPGFNPANPLAREEQREERQGTLGQCPKQGQAHALWEGQKWLQRVP